MKWFAFDREPLSWSRALECLLLSIAAAGLALAYTVIAAQAQHDHQAGHDSYQNWASTKVANCCNNDDCGVVEDSELRETSTGPEVAIDGQWCPVLPIHYIVKGKSPDWSRAHVCVKKKSIYTADIPTCERLLCYSGHGGV